LSKRKNTALQSNVFIVPARSDITCMFLRNRRKAVSFWF